MEQFVLNRKLSGCFDLLNESFNNYRQDPHYDRNLDRLRSVGRSLCYFIDQHQRDTEQERAIKEEDFEGWAFFYHSDFETFWEMNQDEVIGRAINAGWDLRLDDTEHMLESIETYVKNLFIEKEVFFELMDQIELDMQDGVLSA